MDKLLKNINVPKRKKGLVINKKKKNIEIFQKLFMMLSYNHNTFERDTLENIMASSYIILMSNYWFDKSHFKNFNYKYPGIQK